MGRAPCCDKANVKKGPWSPEEDTKLKDYIEKYGTGGNWIALPQKVGLKRCGKSCRLRWLNYLRPNIKHGEFSDEEDRIICTLYAAIGSRWSIIAAQLPGRTDNDIKNYWNTKLKKKLMGLMLPSENHKTKLFQNPNYPLQDYQQPQTSPLPSIPTINYKDCPSFFNPTTKSLLGLEPAQTLPNLLNNTTFTNYNFSPSLETGFSIMPNTQAGLFGPMQGYNGNYPQMKETLLMFGGDQIQASCSSSDGSVSHGREIRQEDLGIFMPNVGFEENPKFVLEYGKSCEAQINTNIGGYFGNASRVVANDNGLDQYGSLEEVKQLISCGPSEDQLYFNGGGDENKTQDQRVMYYY